MLAMANGHATVEPSVESTHPRLVVVIVIDQFRQDYLQRFGAHFEGGGFNRLLREGANFTQAQYSHATTDTCPGHAVISTGTWANQNGIVANRWFDTRRGETVDCASAPGGEIAGNLLRPTIGDVLKEARGGEARVIAVAGKRAAAAMMGGRTADAIYWPGSGWRFDSARHVASHSPGWVDRFNDARLADSYFESPWERLLPLEAYAVQGADDEPAERAADGFGRTFPHRLTRGDKVPGEDFYSAFQSSPFADEVLAEFAKAAIREERLGRGATTDLLSIGFSATDRIGHRFGPDSHEMMDNVVRLDRLLEELLTFIDQQVGLQHTLIVLTSDHGVAPLPERAPVRAGGGAPGRVYEIGLVDAANAALEAAYGPPDSGDWVAFHDFPNLFLNEVSLRAKGILVPDAETLVKRALEDFSGLEAAFTRTELRRLQGTADQPAHARAVLLSFRPERSGHVVYQVAPFNVVAETGTNHGSHWEYDSHVPLLWLGRGVQQGRYDSRVRPVDIAPTLMALLEIEMPKGSSGCILREMFVKAGSREPKCRRAD